MVGADYGVSVVNGEGTNICQSLDLLGAVVMISPALRKKMVATYTSFTCSSVMVKPSCSTRLLMAFQPVSRDVKWI